MTSFDRIVTTLPLIELWSLDHAVPFERKRFLGVRDIKEILRGGPVQFVLANVGDPLTWIAKHDSYYFWKEEVQPRLVNPSATEAGFRLEDYPGGRCYIASEWGDGEQSVIVLEKCH